MTKKRKLKPKQEKFLDALFDEAEGSLSKAKKIAGYSPATSMTHIVTPLAEEIAERTKKYLAYSSPEAAVAVVKILSDPAAIGNKDKLAAAKDILDRANIKPTDKVEVSTVNPLFILPAKKKD